MVGRELGFTGGGTDCADAEDELEEPDEDLDAMGRVASGAGGGAALTLCNVEDDGDGTAACEGSAFVDSSFSNEYGGGASSIS